MPRKSDGDRCPSLGENSNIGDCMHPILTILPPLRCTMESLLQVTYKCKNSAGMSATPKTRTIVIDKEFEDDCTYHR
jgi:hypothetical protein